MLNDKTRSSAARRRRDAESPMTGKVITGARSAYQYPLLIKHLWHAPASPGRRSGNRVSRREGLARNVCATRRAKVVIMNDVASQTSLAVTIGSPPVAVELESAKSLAHRAGEKPRIVIVGGGFAGLAAARALRNANAELILIDRRNHHIFQPLLYQVATAVISPAEIAAPIRQLEAKQTNLTVLLAEITGVDMASRTVEASAPGVSIRKIAFDYLVVATGMRPSYFGHDEFARYAPGLKSLNDAETIRAKILSAFELAATIDDEAERARQMTFVFVGAGPSGVELAA